MWATGAARAVPIRFWRTKSGLECDFVVGRDGDLAIEVKGGANVSVLLLT